METIISTRQIKNHNQQPKINFKIVTISIYCWKSQESKLYQQLPSPNTIERDKENKIIR
jgi:hypothetical protein